MCALPGARASEGSQDKALISIAGALTAAARHQAHGALRCAHEALAHADIVSMSFGALRWAWPLGARAAQEVGKPQSAMLGHAKGPVRIEEVGNPTAAAAPAGSKELACAAGTPGR